jgi:ABC-type lipoprotein release transport system permease subunit
VSLGKWVADSPPVRRGAILDTVIYGASSKDPLAFAAAIFVVALVGAVAFLIPGRRAARANPSDVLRTG